MSGKRSVSSWDIVAPKTAPVRQAACPRPGAPCRIRRAGSTCARRLARAADARGASGSFYDKGLEGASHHAVIPNVNTINNLREVWPRLSSDEKKLFDVIARAYLAALMPDFRYRQTTATLNQMSFFGRLGIDNEFELSRLCHRQVRRLRTP